MGWRCSRAGIAPPHFDELERSWSENADGGIHSTPYFMREPDLEPGSLTRAQVSDLDMALDVPCLSRAPPTSPLTTYLHRPALPSTTPTLA